MFCIWIGSMNGSQFWFDPHKFSGEDWLKKLGLVKSPYFIRRSLSIPRCLFTKPDACWLKLWTVVSSLVDYLFNGDLKIIYGYNFKHHTPYIPYANCWWHPYHIEVKFPCFLSESQCEFLTSSIPNFLNRNPNWLVVWNMNFIFPFSWGCHHPNWLSYFSEGLKPPRSQYLAHKNLLSPQIHPHLSSANIHMNSSQTSPAFCAS